MGRVRIGSGSCAVYLDDAQAAAFNRVLRNLAPAVVSRLEAAASELLTEARDGWPVSPDSGPPRTRKDGQPDRRAERRKTKNKEHSRDLFETGIEYDGDRTIGVYVKNSANYVYMIKTWQGKLYGQSPWVELIRKPANKLKRKLAKELQSELSKLAKG